MGLFVDKGSGSGIFPDPDPVTQKDRIRNTGANNYSVCKHTRTNCGPEMLNTTLVEFKCRNIISFN